MIIRSFRKGQSIVEYTMLILLVTAALIVMTTYITRAVNARVKQTEDEYEWYTKDS